MSALLFNLAIACVLSLLVLVLVLKGIARAGRNRYRVNLEAVPQTIPESRINPAATAPPEPEMGMSKTA